MAHACLNGVDGSMYGGGAASVSDHGEVAAESVIRAAAVGPGPYNVTGILFLSVSQRHIGPSRVSSAS
jgi:hypothetical protein